MGILETMSSKIDDIYDMFVKEGKIKKPAEEKPAEEKPTEEKPAEEKPAEESEPDVYDLPNSTLKIRNIQPSSNSILDEFKEMFDSDNYNPLPTSITIDSLTENQKKYINEIFSKNNDLSQKYLFFYYANNHFTIYSQDNNNSLQSVFAVTPDTGETLESIVSNFTETSANAEHFILYSSEKKPAEEKPDETPSLKFIDGDYIWKFDHGGTEKTINVKIENGVFKFNAWNTDNEYEFNNAENKYTMTKPDKDKYAIEIKNYDSNTYIYTIREFAIGGTWDKTGSLTKVPTIKTNEDGTKTIELDSSSYPVKWAYTESDDNGIKYNYGNPTNVTCPDGYKIIIESINGSTKRNFNTKRKSINDLHKYILSLRPGSDGYGGVYYMGITGENWDHDTTNFYVYAQKLQENEIYQFSTIKTDENSGIKTIELNNTNNSTFVTRWAYTEGDSEGIKYDHGKNINVTCPDGYKIIIEAIELDLTTYSLDTKMKSISDLHTYILSLNDEANGYGNIKYMYGANGNNYDYSHQTTNYYMYVKQLEENEEYRQQKSIRRKKIIIRR